MSTLPRRTNRAGPRAGLFLSLAALSAVPAGAQSSGISTYCNPIDIEYRYNFEQQNEGISYRSGADPVVVTHKGEYFLFSTIAGGYWHSKDLVHWRFVTPSRWPFEDVVAPAAMSFGDTLLLLQSATAPRPILYSTSPATGRLEFYNRMLPWLPNARHHDVPTPAAGDSAPPGPWDPSLFRDERSGRWFMYWGSSNFYPLYGIELDPARRLTYMGKPKALLALKPKAHGWERFGWDHRDTTTTPFVEGAFMTEHGGRYYLQYGAPGTEYNVYANGTYVGTDPMGPFTYAPYNPVAYKPGGFMTGAGHGSTFRDVHGNYWNTGTPWIGINWNFERRISMFPAGFDRDGQMFANTRFGDFPHRAPTKRWHDRNELFTGWMLLSYRKRVSATSARDSFPAANVTDENPRTYWVARGAAPGEGLTLDLGAAYDVRALQVNFADYRSNLYVNDSTVYTQFRMHASLDGVRWQVITDLSGERRDRPNAYVELPAPARARYVRYEHVHIGAPNLAISDIRVFGNGGGSGPATPGGVGARRQADARNADVTWKPVRGAVGYNVLWGITREKLYQTYQRFADQGTTLELRALTVGQGYWVAVEAFDESGVSRQSVAVPLR